MSSASFPFTKTQTSSSPLKASCGEVPASYVNQKRISVVNAKLWLFRFPSRPSLPKPLPSMGKNPPSELYGASVALLKTYE